MLPRLILLLPTLAGLGLLAGGAGAGPPVLSPPPAAPSAASFFSFEKGWQGWRVRGVDLDLGDSQIEWYIRRSRALAQRGLVSLELYLANFNDAGKIWVERPFRLQPGQRYKVRLDLALGSSDWGDFCCPFEIVAGAATQPPRTPEAIARNRRGSTYNGGAHGWVWLRKSYTFEARADERGLVWVFAGIWGTWETPQRYFLDSVRVTLEPL